jgi:hypothetical protein
MLFHIGPIPPNPEFHPEKGGWQKIRELPFILFLLLALPIAVLIAIGVFAALSTIEDPSARIVIRPGSLNWMSVTKAAFFGITGFLALILVHEAIHVLGYPGMGSSQETIVGVWPSRGLAYAYYGGEIARSQFILMLALPFLTLTVLPLVVCMITQRVPFWVAFVALVNGIGSCMDLLVIVYVLVMTPRDAILRNNGWDTYWRLSSARAAT